MEIIYVLASITFLAWGTGDLFTIYAARKIGANLTCFWIFAFNFILLTLLLPFFPHNFMLINVPLLLLNIFLGSLFVLANLFITEAFNRSSAPLVGIVVQSFPGIVLILSAIFFKDSITPTQLLFATIIFVGVFLCSVDLMNLRKAQKIVDFGTFLAIAGALCLAIYFTFSRILITSYGWFLPLYISTALTPILIPIMKKQNEKLKMPKNSKVIIALFLVGFIIRSGDFALNYGITLPHGSSIITPIAGSSPILFVTLSALIYKDKVSKQQMVGIIVTLIGLLLLTLLGNK